MISPKQMLLELSLKTNCGALDGLQSVPVCWDCWQLSWADADCAVMENPASHRAGMSVGLLILPKKRELPIIPQEFGNLGTFLGHLRLGLCLQRKKEKKKNPFKIRNFGVPPWLSLGVFGVMESHIYILCLENKSSQGNPSFLLWKNLNLALNDGMMQGINNWGLAGCPNVSKVCLATPGLPGGLQDQPPSPKNGLKQENFIFWPPSLKNFPFQSLLMLNLPSLALSLPCKYSKFGKTRSVKSFMLPHLCFPIA